MPNVVRKSGEYVYYDDGSAALQTHTDNAPDSNSITPIDKQAQLKTQIESNTTPLGANATYTGASFDTMADGINYTWLTGHIFANQSGSLGVQQSADGTTWEALDTINLTGTKPEKINVEILSRYVRIVVVNGATAQTILRLQAFITFKG